LYYFVEFYIKIVLKIFGNYLANFWHFLNYMGVILKKNKTEKAKRIDQLV